MRKVLLLIVLVLLVAAHAVYWYFPRERAGVPDPSDLPGRLLAAGEPGEICLWLPYPHQNLGALRDAIGDPEEVLAAAARLGGSKSSRPPSFGPFAVPPSRELTICTDASGERLRGVARVYPGLAFVAKLAGKLAGNPWLAGGAVESGQRRGRAAWHGTLWTVELGDSFAEPPIAGPTIEKPTFAAARFGSGTDSGPSRVPEGLYLLRRSPSGWVVGLAQAPQPRLPAEALATPNGEARPIALVFAGGVDGEAPAGIAFYDDSPDEQNRDQGGVGSFGLPGIALLSDPERPRWSLPGGGLGGLLTDRLPKADVDGWSLLALDEQSLEHAKRLAPRLARLREERGGVVRLAVEVNPPRALASVSQVREGLEKIPILPLDEVQRWRDWQTLLSPLARCQKGRLVAEEHPRAFLAELSDCR